MNLPKLRTWVDGSIEDAVPKAGRVACSLQVGKGMIRVHLPHTLFPFALRFGRPFRLSLRPDADGHVLTIEPQAPEPLSPEDQDLYDQLIASVPPEIKST